MHGIQQIYVISRAQDAHRRDCVLAQLRALGLDADGLVRQFAAVEPDFAEPAMEARRRGFGWMWQVGPHYQRGALGCLLSHIAVCEAARAAGHTRVMILEDDVYLASTFAATLQRLLVLLDRHFPGWAALNLETRAAFDTGRKMDVALRTRDEAVLLRTYSSRCTAGLVLNASAIAMVADEALAYNREIDIFYSLEVYNRLPCYMVPYGAALVQGNYVSTITGLCEPQPPAFRPLYDAAAMWPHTMDACATWDWARAVTLDEADADEAKK